MSATAPDFFTIRLKNLEPCWVGRNPFASGFAIGATDGTVAFTNESGDKSNHLNTAAKDAITGAASQDDYLAISSGQVVSVFVLSRDAGAPILCSTLPHGAHGVLAASNGDFFAPAGHDGLLHIKPARAPNVDYRIQAFQGPPLNLYQLCEIPTYQSKSLFVAACRSQGVGLIDHSSASAETGLQIGTFQGVDVVDVVSIGNAAYPFAIAAAGVGGEIWLCRDIVRQEVPILLHYQSFAGRVYRILSAAGHLFVLTSKAIYVLADLAARLVQPVFDKNDARVMTIPIEAVDAAIVDDQWLVVVLPDLLRRYDLKTIHRQIADSAGYEVKQEFINPVQPYWTPREMAFA